MMTEVTNVTSSAPDAAQGVASGLPERDAMLLAASPSREGAGAASGAEPDRNLLGMAADLLTEPGGDDPGQLSGEAGVGSVFLGDGPFLDHPAGAG